jgi:hypothetical protein
MVPHLADGLFRAGFGEDSRFGNRLAQKKAVGKRSSISSAT